MVRSITWQVPCKRRHNLLGEKLTLAEKCPFSIRKEGVEQLVTPCIYEDCPAEEGTAFSDFPKVASL